MYAKLLLIIFLPLLLNCPKKEEKISEAKIIIKIWDFPRWPHGPSLDKFGFI